MSFNWFNYLSLYQLLMRSKLSIKSVPQELHLIIDGFGSSNFFVFKFMRNYSESGGVYQDEPQVEPFSTKSDFFITLTLFAS
jgi:hypothetical protein